MKIVIDGRMLYWTGVGRYILALLEELQTLDTQNSYVVLVRRADWKLWEPTASNFAKVECNINPYTLGEQLGLFWQLRNLQADVVHFTAPNTPLLYRGPRVITVHDLTLLDFDTSRGQGFIKWLRGLKRIPFRLVLRSGVRSAQQIITMTGYVRAQIIERFGVSGERISVTLAAADLHTAETAPLERFGALGQYIFYVGNVFPYKNVAATLRAIAALSEQYPDLQLIAAGKRDVFTDELEALASELGLAQRVRFVGFVSEAEKQALYRGAAAYMNPSLSEGFGLQGLEAMAQGTPVVAARASCLPEVYGEAAEYFDPNDPTDQAAALARVMGDKALAGRLRTAGAERIKQFSWRRMAEETLAVYRKVGR